MFLLYKLYFILLFSLGCIKNRFEAAMELFNVKPVTGLKPYIKTDLGINSMSHLMSHIYAFESALYAVAGKSFWLNFKNSKID